MADKLRQDVETSKQENWQMQMRKFDYDRYYY